MRERSKALNNDEEISKLLRDSTMLIKYLPKDKSATHIVHYKSTCNLKHNQYQIKIFDSASPTDIVRGIWNIPFEDTELLIHSSNSKYNHARILSNTNSVCRLVEIS